MLQENENKPAEVETEAQNCESPGKKPAGLRKRKPPVEKVSGAKKELEEKISSLDEASMKELQFHREKLEPLNKKWEETSQDLVKKYLGPFKPETEISISPERLVSAMRTRLEGKEMSKEDSQYLIYTLGYQIDGQQLPLIEVAQHLQAWLTSAGVTEGTFEEKDLGRLIEDLATYEEANLQTGPIKFWDLKLLGVNFPDNYLAMNKKRRKLLYLCDCLQKLTKALSKPGNSEKLLNKIREADKKLQSAQAKLEKEKGKEKKEVCKKNELEEKRREEEKKRLEKEKRKEEKELKKKLEEEKKEEKKEEKRRLEEEKKEEKRRQEEEKRRLEEEKKEEKRKLEEQKKEEKRKQEEERNEQKRLEKIKKEEEEKKKNGVALTKFFNVVHKPADSKDEALNEEPEKPSLWKTNLGTLPRFSEWGEDRKECFDDSLQPGAIRLELELLMQELKEQIQHSRENRPKLSETECLHRKVFIKYEDYLADCYEYRGNFKRRSEKIGGRKPFSKDEELIDYELSSDEEFQLEEAESINSKAEDEDEDDSMEGEEDNFVVPDGYLSDEEAGSLDGEDKAQYINRKKMEHSKGGPMKTHYYDFTSFQPGRDCSLDELVDRLKVFPIGSSFPLAIEPEESDNGMSDEFLIDLVRSIHCCPNKLAVIERMKDKYKIHSKMAIKQKVEDISTNGVIIDPQLYIKNGATIEDYLKDVKQLFLSRDDCSEDEATGTGAAQEEPEQKETAGAGEKDKKQRERMDNEKKWVLARMMNGTKEGVTKPKNKTIKEFLTKYPNLPKRQADIKARELAINIYLVDPEVFEDLGIEGEFLKIIENTFKSRRPEPSAEQEEDQASHSPNEKDVKEADEAAKPEPMQEEPLKQPPCENSRDSTAEKENLENGDKEAKEQIEAQKPAYKQTDIKNFFGKGGSKGNASPSKSPVKSTSSLLKSAEKENNRATANKEANE